MAEEVHKDIDEMRSWAHQLSPHVQWLFHVVCHFVQTEQERKLRRGKSAFIHF